MHVSYHQGHSIWEIRVDGWVRCLWADPDVPEYVTDGPLTGKPIPNLKGHKDNWPLALEELDQKLTSR